MVVKLNVLLNASPRFLGRDVIVQIDVFVLQAAPEPLGKDIVQRAFLPVHTDANLGVARPGQVFLAGEMAALVAIEDLGLPICQRPFDGVQDETNVQRLIQFIADDVAGMQSRMATRYIQP